MRKLLSAGILVSLIGLLSSGLADASRQQQHPLACSKPGGRFKVIASSPNSTVFRRGGILPEMKGCQRGHALLELGEPVSSKLVRTRGRWVTYPESGGDAQDSYYDMILVELRKRGGFRRFALAGGVELDPIKAISLGASGAVLYIQRVGDEERVVLVGRTKRRQLDAGPVGTLTRPQIKGRVASWTSPHGRQRERFKLKRGLLRH